MLNNQWQASGPGPGGDPLRPLKLMTVFNLVLLSVQAWTGDVLVIFAAYAMNFLVLYYSK